jgi:hypothetical protein
LAASFISVRPWRRCTYPPPEGPSALPAACGHWGAGAGLGCTQRVPSDAPQRFTGVVICQRTAQKLLWIALSTTVRLLTLRALISSRNALAHSPQARNPVRRFLHRAGFFLCLIFGAGVLIRTAPCPASSLVPKTETTPASGNSAEAIILLELPMGAARLDNPPERGFKLYTFRRKQDAVALPSIRPRRGAQLPHQSAAIQREPAR